MDFGKWATGGRNFFAPKIPKNLELVPLGAIFYFPLEKLKKVEPGQK
jgi:hypothetical protein